jgi:hypothetical protein
MKNGMIAALLVIAIIGGAGAGYLAGEANPRVTTIVSSATTTSTTTLFIEDTCSIPVSPATTAGMTDVYDVSPGSVGTICVNYHFDAAGSLSFASPGYGPLYYGVNNGHNTVGYYSCPGGGTFPNGTSATGCSEVRVTSSMGEFSHGADANVSVVYTITAEKNATGVFLLFVDSCDNVPITLGTPPASIVEPAFSCVTSTNQPSYDAVTAVSNIIVSVVPLQY